MALSLPLGLTAAAQSSAEPAAVTGGPQAMQYESRFLELYGQVMDPANGYFSEEGIPYHAVETLNVEAPDHGHETTSEAYSWAQVSAYANGTGPAPTFEYHRFWAQADIALALGTYADLFGE